MKEEEEKIESIDDLVERLNKLNDSYEEEISLNKEELPESLGQEKKADIEIDEDKEREKIEESLLEEDKINRKKIDSNYEKSANLLDNKVENYKKSAENAKNEVNINYDRARVKAENDALKRGLARSSIVVSSLTNIEDSRAAKLSDIATDLENNLATISTDLEKLSAERDMALDDLDISLARNISAKLDARMKELKTAQEKVVEYNNNIEKLERQYQADRIKKMSDQKKAQYEFENKYGTQIKGEIDAKKKELTISYLSTLPKEEAIKALISSPELARALGDYYYDIYYIESRRK